MFFELKLQSNRAALDAEQIQYPVMLAHLRPNFVHRLGYATLQIQGMEPVEHQETANQRIASQVIEDLLARVVVLSDNLHDALQTSRVQIEKQLHQLLGAGPSRRIDDAVEFMNQAADALNFFLELFVVGHSFRNSS